MTQESQLSHLKLKSKLKQETIDGKLITPSKLKSYFVESFVLNSEDRIVSRK